MTFQISYAQYDLVIFKEKVKVKIILRYFNFELSFKLWWFHAQDLFGSQIPVTTGGFVL